MFGINKNQAKLNKTALYYNIPPTHMMILMAMMTTTMSIMIIMMSMMTVMIDKIYTMRT